MSSRPRRQKLSVETKRVFRPVRHTKNAFQEKRSKKKYDLLFFCKLKIEKIPHLHYKNVPKSNIDKQKNRVASITTPLQKP